MENIAIILAGGKGKRLQHDTPKQFLIINGLTCLEHTTLEFIKNNSINEVIIVSNTNYTTEIKELFKKYTEKKITIISGGENRNLSSLNAINYIKEKNNSDSNLIIHDAARPLVSQYLINNCIKKLAIYNAVSVAIPVTDTILETKNDRVKSIPQRSQLMCAQTPQCFKLSLLAKAYDIAYNENKKLDLLTDNCSVFKKYLPNEQIYIVQGEYSNIKLTRIEDLVIIKNYFNQKK